MTTTTWTTLRQDPSLSFSCTGFFVRNLDILPNDCLKKVTFDSKFLLLWAIQKREPRQGRRVEGTENSARLPARSRGIILNCVGGSRKKFAGITLAVFPVPSNLRPWNPGPNWDVLCFRVIKVVSNMYVPNLKLPPTEILCTQSDDWN